MNPMGKLSKMTPKNRIATGGLAALVVGSAVSLFALGKTSQNSFYNQNSTPGTPAMQTCYQNPPDTEKYSVDASNYSRARAEDSGSTRDWARFYGTIEELKKNKDLKSKTERIPYNVKYIDQALAELADWLKSDPHFLVREFYKWEGDQLRASYMFRNQNIQLSGEKYAVDIAFDISSCFDNVSGKERKKARNIYFQISGPVVVYNENTPKINRYGNAAQEVWMNWTEFFSDDYRIEVRELNGHTLRPKAEELDITGIRKKLAEGLEVQVIAFETDITSRRLIK